MVEPKQLPPRDASLSFLVGGATYYVERVDHTQTTITVADVTPEAAEMTKAVARSQFEVPAQEATKQEIARASRAKQETLRLAIVGVCVLAACFVIYSKQDTGWPLAALLSVFGGAAAAPSIIDKLKEKPKLPPGT